MKKEGGKSQKTMPKLYINNKIVKPIKKDSSFLYLGRNFNFKMDNEKHKEFLLNTLNTLMDEIDALPLHPRNKIKLYQLYVLSKISWHLTVADLSDTWVKQNLDPILTKNLRSWLEIPIGGTIKIVQLTKNKYGLGVSLVSTKFAQCQVSFRKSLRSSNNVDIRRIYKETSKAENVKYDCYKNTCDAIK